MAREYIHELLIGPVLSGIQGLLPLCYLKVRLHQVCWLGRCEGMALLPDGTAMLKVLTKKRSNPAQSRRGPRSRKCSFFARSWAGLEVGGLKRTKIGMSNGGVEMMLDATQEFQQAANKGNDYLTGTPSSFPEFARPAINFESARGVMTARVRCKWCQTSRSPQSSLRSPAA